MEDENCKCSRRELLQWGTRAGIALTFGQMLGLTALFAQPAKSPKACILLWMAGGPSQLDTFDPKPGTDTGGEFKAISTSVAGIQISEHLPLLAREMKDVSIIRSMNSKEGNHDRARFFVHTGYAPAGVTQYPSFGSIVAKELVSKSDQLPAYVSINGPGISSGILGVNFAPFVIRDSLRPLDHLEYSDSVDAERFNERLSLLKKMNDPFNANHSFEELNEKDIITQRAVDLMRSPALTAFNIRKEKSTTREMYGNSKFGTGCLIARRLVQNGSRFVEVEMDGWDTHVQNFSRTKELCQELDPAFSSLIRDLRENGLLETTLVLWMGEFGRTPIINAQAGRDHWPRAWTAVVAGCGIKGGQVIGTTDAKGMEISNQPVSVPDFYATLCKCLGIDDSKYNSSPLGRPIRITDYGKPIAELL
jgi:uncharacterized protein (DUF1501 family)